MKLSSQLQTWTAFVPYFFISSLIQYVTAIKKHQSQRNADPPLFADFVWAGEVSGEQLNSDTHFLRDCHYFLAKAGNYNHFLTEFFNTL